MLISFVKPIPRDIPSNELVVNYDVALPEMSPILLAFANCIFILPLDAEASRKQIFLPMLAIDASIKKWVGNFNVKISM